MPEEKSYSSMYSRNAELYHHGIKGQKWGVKNGPPYPLGSDVSTGSRLKKRMEENVNKYYDEKRQNKEAQLRKLEKKELKNEDKQAKLSKEREKLAIKKEKVKNLIEKYSNKSYSETVGELTDTQADAISTAIWFSAVMALIGIPILKSNISVNKEIKRNIENSEAEGPLKKTKQKGTIESEAKKINPNYDPHDRNYTMNCVLCSASYDMRRRGYDVEANPSKYGRRTQNIANMYNVSKKEISKTRDYATFRDDLKNMPDGARGIMCVNAGDWGSRHALAWEKQENTVMVIDAQDNTIVNFGKAVKTNLINTDQTYEYEYLRTDDKTFNEYYIRDAVKNRR